VCLTEQAHCGANSLWKHHRHKQTGDIRRSVVPEQMQLYDVAARVGCRRWAAHHRVVIHCCPWPSAHSRSKRATCKPCAHVSRSFSDWKTLKSSSTTYVLCCSSLHQDVISNSIGYGRLLARLSDNSAVVGGAAKSICSPLIDQNNLTCICHCLGRFLSGTLATGLRHDERHRTDSAAFKIRSLPDFYRSYFARRVVLGQLKRATSKPIDFLN